MKKRLITLLLTMVLGIMISAQVAAAAQPTYYEVGYAKVDINPYDLSTPDPYDLMAIPMAGNGFTDRRWSIPEKLDDNGDGKVDGNDGLFAICIAITDQKGNTLLQFTVDTINANPNYVNVVRQRLVEKYPELSADRIMFNASHTHSGPDLASSWKSGAECSEDFVTYLQMIQDQMVLAADMALADRTPATMYKGRLEANESKAIKGDIGDTLNESLPAGQKVTVLDGSLFPDRKYNAVRHYLSTVQDAKRTVVRKYTAANTVTLSDGSKVGQYAYYSYPKEGGLYIPDLNSEKVSYVGGDNFNGVSSEGTHIARSVGYVNFQGKEVSEAVYKASALKADAGTGVPTAWWAADMTVVSSVDHVSETDDTLQVLEFRFDAKYNKKPIVLVNWRAHMTLNRSVSVDYRANEKLASLGNYTSYYQMSGDWANAMRYVLERKGYRPALLQGAAGNINGGSRIQSESSWLNYQPEATDAKGNVIKGKGEGYYEGVKLSDTSYARNKGNIYGSELAEVVLECLNEHMEQINVKGGEIRSVQVKFQTTRQQVTMAGYQAGKYYAEHYNPASPTGLFRYEYVYWVDAEGNALVDEEGTPYTDAEGNVLTDANGKPVTELVPAKKVTEYCHVTSIHHANSMVSKYSSNGKASAALELNAIMIGNEFAMVTSPNELFDRYSETADQYNMTDNLWEIVDDYTPGSYGEPFIAGYSNGSGSYLPSQATYFFSQDNDKYATGSYETLTSQYAPGNGEAVIHQFDIMLDFLQKEAVNPVETEKGTCPLCEKEVEWTELTEDTGELKIANMRTGHYYLSGDLTLESKQAMTGAQMCLDLRGHTLTVKKGFTVCAGATVNLVGDGVVQGDDAPTNGGVFTVAEGGTLNLYSATVRYVGEATTDGPITNGGIIELEGTLNMYGGVVEGTSISWAGAAIYAGSQSHLNIYGGQILSGKAGASGNCVYARGSMRFSGDPVIQDIRVNPKEDGPALEDMITVSGRFTGLIKLTINSVFAGMDIGTSDNADLSNGKLYASSSRVAMVEGTDLKLYSLPAVAVVDEKGAMTYGESLAQAVEQYAGTGAKIVLQKNNTEDIAISKDLYMDLNGFSATGAITVAQGATLYVMDFATADYDISDGKYGQLTKVTGRVEGMPAAGEQDIYLKVQEEGAVSFHALCLNIRAMALRPAEGGLYYVCDFGGDTLAAEQVAAYGIAMSLERAPTQQNMGKFTQREDTLGTANGTLLKGIMKEENGRVTNCRNAAIPVYGRAYAVLKDGTYLFGVTRCRSLQEQVELADAQWLSLSHGEQEALKALYESFRSEMGGWDIPNLKASGK